MSRALCQVLCGGLPCHRLVDPAERVAVFRHRVLSHVCSPPCLLPRRSPPTCLRCSHCAPFPWVLLAPPRRHHLNPGVGLSRQATETVLSSAAAACACRRRTCAAARVAPAAASAVAAAAASSSTLALARACLPGSPLRARAGSRPPPSSPRCSRRRGGRSAAASYATSPHCPTSSRLRTTSTLTFSPSIFASS